jgi:hypothetical protein
VQAERAQHDDGVASGLELLSLSLQAPPQVAEVVNFAVEDDHVPGHRVNHGLIAGRRKVKNGEPTVSQQHPPTAVVWRGAPHPASVRTAVDHGVIHALEGRPIGFVQSSDDARNATHPLGPSRKPTSKRMKNDIERELLELYDFCPDAAARFPPSIWIKT